MFLWYPNSITEVEQKAIQLKSAGFLILGGPRKTSDGYYEYKSFDPDNSRLEVTCIIQANNDEKIC